VAELAQRLGFDLPNAFSRHLEALPNLFERVLGAIFQAEAHLDDVADRTSGNNRIRYAYSNPCFEIWLLWHAKGVAC